VKRTLWTVLAGLCLVSPIAAQTPPRALVNQPINEAERTTLHGNVSPLAQPQYDQGKVSDSLPASRVLLMLGRPPEREAALQQYLLEVHSKGSTTYHHWITPQQFGDQFGPADTDVQAVTNWLGSKGFRITKISQGKQFIELSGTAGQLHDAFQAEIHQYNVNGEMHYANAHEISVPTALAQVVRGLLPLNNFRAEPYIKAAGTARVSKSTHTMTPDWTVPNPFGSSNPLGFLLAPEDLATQYDITPLYQAGTNGSGTTIGIIDESNIDLSLVSDYQQLFGISGTTPQVIIDGDDPGDVPEADLEAYLDVELSGAIAPKSAINLYISDGGSVADPLVFASIRAVEDNAASVLSASFGECEELLGESGNQFWADLWEQAAAQGQTVMVATGDSGAVCNYGLGVSVNGVSSTPWNVAVGGTDFFYSDYATGGASVPNFWNSANDANLGSLKAPLTEQAWNDGFGLDVIPNGFEFGELGSGGGGASSCATSSTNSGACVGGYPKPVWQTGTGVPSDGVRDVPDVSWFASNGANLSAYAICAEEGECTTEPATDAEIFVVGGTSTSAPSMAGIMALVNQKFGRQGQANFTLYPLAKQKPAAFHDVTEGSNQEECSAGSPGCVENAQLGGIDETTVYVTTTGYDQATGLGSIDADQLVTNWDSITFKSSTTNLTLSPTTITHGTPVLVTSTVTGTGGVPTGDVALLTNSPEPFSQSVTIGTLNGGTTSSDVNFFPGGTYQVTAQYGGDGRFGASSSTPVTLTVNPEKSVISLEVVNNNAGYATSGFSLPYNTLTSMNVLPTSVTGASGGPSDGTATGTATFTLDSTNATVPLDAEGLADFTAPTLSVGSHTVGASYSGDASFEPSTATPITFTVTKGIANLNVNLVAPLSGPNYVFTTTGNGNTANVTVTVQVAANSSAPGTAAPTGTVMVCLGFQLNCVSPQYSQNGTLSGPTGLYAEIVTATVTFTGVISENYALSFTYSGDANWQSSSFTYAGNIEVTGQLALPASSTNLAFSPLTLSGSQLTQVTTTVTGSGNSGVAPTGLIDYYDDGLFLTQAQLTAGAGQTSTAAFELGTAYFFNSGPNQMTAVYQGDTHYLPSTSTTATVTATQIVGNFTLTPSASEITLQPGSSTSIPIGLASASNFSGNVTMTCATSSPNLMCSVPATTALNGLANPSLMITASAEAGTPPVAPAGGPFDGRPAAALAIVAASLLLLGTAIRRRRSSLRLAMGLGAVILVMAGCGGGSSGTPPPPPPPAAATYSVVVSAVGNGILHSAKIVVYVP
jgi:subtilase family serine protease